MARLRRVPPGRAGRLWLQHRLDLAERAAGRLDQKLRLLHEERLRLSLRAERTGLAWEDAHREAQEWLVRALVLAGDRGIRLATPESDAEVRLTWTQTMGVDYPSEAVLTVPAPVEGALPALSAAVHGARAAHRVAAAAAVQHAAAVAAVRVVADAEASTRHRLRALTAHWTPRLTQGLADLRLALEEQEQEEAVRLRWVQAHVAVGPGRGARP